MDNLTWEEKTELLDRFGKRVIEFRDNNLEFFMEHATTGKSVNPVMRKQYGILATLSDEQREKVNDLLSETITTAIFDFLHMFADYEDEMKLILIKDGKEYDYTRITEHAGSEIACHEDDGWIQKFSKVGRFVL